MRSHLTALIAYAIIMTGAVLALSFTVITDKDHPPSSSYNLSLCSLPAVSRFDLRPDPNNDLATNRTPCAALPAGLMLVCSDHEPRASVLDCADVRTLIVR